MDVDKVSPTTAGVGGPWLLEVKAHKQGLVFWLIVFSVVVAPLMSLMAGGLVVALVWMLFTNPGNTRGQIAVAVMLVVVGPVVLAAPLVFIRMSLAMWRCLRNGRPAVRADAEGLETYNLYKGWERLPWAEVGAIALPKSYMLVIEHIDPKVWLARQTLWRRLVVRNSRKHTHLTMALGFGLPLEEHGEVVMYKIAAIRDAKHAGMKVEAGDAAADVKER